MTDRFRGRRLFGILLALTMTTALSGCGVAAFPIASRAPRSRSFRSPVMPLQPR
jgi:hypothetical protein